MSTTSKDDYNLQEAWDRVCGSFAKTTNGLDLTKPPKYTLDQVLEQIRAKQDEDDEKNAKFKVAKDVISKTLDCINILGGIAAQGASMVFGPSNMCFNAVSYLIQTGANYKRIFTSLAELFGRISDVLERCKIYLRMPPESVDIALRRIINEELLCFVSICALSTKVLKGHKILITLKVIAFNSDEGVSDELDKLSVLVDKEDQMRATLGFESLKSSEKSITETKEGTKRINANVDKVLELERQREADNKNKKQLKEIDANLDNPSEIFKVILATYKGIQNKKVEGSGEWLKQDPLYTAWATCDDSPPFSILCISGGEGYGKSFLYPTVIRDLQDRSSQTANNMSCVSVAYYFFQQESIAKGSQQADNDTPLLVKALKVLAWQVANNDVVYRKDLASVQASGVTQIKPLWDMLFAKAYKTDSTMFVLFDGMDQLEKEQINDFSKLLVELRKIAGGWKFRLRILLSGRDATIELVGSYLAEKVAIVHIASRNGDDIEKFIKSRIKRMDILTGTSPQVETLRAEILTKLIEEANGDFINVGLLLNEIGEKQRPGEIRDVLSKSGEKRSNTIARKIEGLNETLGDNDISDLNELLTWVMCAIRPLTLEELEAVLFVKNREPSLRLLSDEIKDRYSALFRVLGDVDPETKKLLPTATVSLVSDSIEDYLVLKAEREADEDSQAWDSTGDVNESEVRIIRRFLESVCDPNLFRKFEFESFFERKLSRRTTKVGVNLETAHLQIATTCIQTICAEESVDLAPLVQYSTQFFSAHLTKVDPSLTQPEAKVILGPKLLALFTDKNVIKKWWTNDDIWSAGSAWLYSDDSTEVILKWLRDSAVTKRLSEHEKKWVRSLSSKSEPDADLLEYIAKFVAQKWLQSSEWALLPLFSWVHGYITKIANRKDPLVKRSMEAPNATELEVSQILAAANWARESIGLQSLGYEETRNVARVFREYEKHEKAIEYFKLASSLQPDNWLSQWGLARVYDIQKNWALAIETLEIVKTSIETGEAKDGDPTTELPEMALQLASWNKHAGNDERALEIYEAVLKENPQDYSSALDIISLLRKKGDFTRLLGFLETLKSAKDELTGLDRRTQLFHFHSWRRDYHEIIVAVGFNLRSFDVVKEGYRTALEAGELELIAAKERSDRWGESKTQEIIAMLLHYFALFFYIHHANDDEKQHAISLWERILRMDDLGNYLIIWAKRLVSITVSSAYLQEARLAGKDSETAAKYIEKLEQLSVINNDEDMSEIPIQLYSKQLLARWYCLTGQKSKAKDMLRVYVKTSLDLLSDDDPTNDYQAYQGLASHFMYVGEDDDALASWSLITPNSLEPEHSATTTRGSEDLISDENQTRISNGNSKDGSIELDQEPTHVQANCATTNEPVLSSTRNTDKQPESTHSGTKELVGPMEYACDGECGTTWTYADDFYACRDCTDIQFDKRCLEALRAGTLEKLVCNKNHDMLYVPKFDEIELKRIGKGNVKVGTTIIKVNDWILRIKKEWDIAV